MGTYPPSGTSASPFADAEDVFAALLDIRSYHEGDLRSLLNTLMAEELEISKRRRIRQVQIDTIRAELVRRKRGELGDR